ncbi:MAG: dephospho-CoA kinase [Beduini sp.]|uniref:dephospho-CoA kinase n=1 Tax=Beduini sp. TaxID=1922300 RepID=UPI0039A02407
MIIGITGGIASGKSTVSQYLKDNGFFIIDADQLSKDALTVDQTCIQQVLLQFDCSDEAGNIDRAKLGAIIFNDKKAQAQLESIVHPYVIKKMKEAIQNCKEEWLFLDIPLLYEAHLEYLCDQILVVYVEEQKQLERLRKRNALSAEEAKARIYSQMPLIEKKQKANYVIDNNGNRKELIRQVDHFIQGLKKGDILWENY